MKTFIQNAVGKTWQAFLCGLLLFVLGGCSTPLPNPALRNAANVWVGSDQGIGRWSVKPGDADIEITRVDSITGDFPPLSYLDTHADLSTPLHLVVGRHTIDLLLGTAFSVHPNPGSESETVQVRGSGTVEALFLANHAYRFTALWINGSASRSGAFDVTLWDVTQSDDSPVRVQSWSFRGSQITGPPGYAPL